MQENYYRKLLEGLKCSCWRWRWHWQLCIIMILHCNSSSSSLLSCSLSYVMLNLAPPLGYKAGWRNSKTIKKDEEWEFYHEIWRPILRINNILEKRTRKPGAASQWSTATWPKDKNPTFLALPPSNPVRTVLTKLPPNLAVMGYLVCGD